MRAQSRPLFRSRFNGLQNYFQIKAAAARKIGNYFSTHVYLIKFVIVVIGWDQNLRELSQNVISRFTFCVKREICE